MFTSELEGKRYQICKYTEEVDELVYFPLPKCQRELKVGVQTQNSTDQKYENDIITTI